MRENIKFKHIAAICFCDIILLLFYVFSTIVCIDWFPWYEQDNLLGIMLMGYSPVVIMIHSIILMMNFITRETRVILMILIIIILSFIILVEYLAMPKIYIFILILEIIWFAFEVYNTLRTYKIQ